MQPAPQAIAIPAAGNRPASMMSFIDAIKSGLQGTTTFDGRASRSQFWWFALFYQLIAFGMSTLAVLIDQPLIAMAVYLLIPSYLAVTAKRLHDVGKSGWFMLIPIYNLVLFVTDGEAAPNAYGDVPTNTL